MSLKKIAVCVIVAFVIIEVRSQVCTKQVQTSTVQTYSYVTTEKLCGNCASRQQIKTKFKLVNITVMVVECCHGYTRLDNNLEASSTNCLKVDQTPHVRGCSETCRNGECSKTNECICYESYEQYPPGSNTCVDKCNPGYDRINGRCQPRCTKSCYGGYCAAHEECLCHTGWEKNEQGECILTCNPECGNGTCIDPNKCSCSNGYKLIKNANPQCVTTEVTSESTVTNINAYDHSPIPTKSAPIGTDVKKYKSSTERHDEKSTQPDGNGSPTLLYVAVGANIILLIIIISIILYKNPAIYKRFQASNCTKKTREDGEVLHYDYVQLPLPIRTREENVYSI